MEINGKTIKLGWISGMPRSGTTWLSQIFASCVDVRMKFCPLFSYEFKNILDENSSSIQWEKLFSDVYQTKSEYLDQEYPFEIKIPDNILKNNSTLEGKLGQASTALRMITGVSSRIDWIVRAQLDIPKKFDVKQSQKIILSES